MASRGTALHRRRRARHVADRRRRHHLAVQDAVAAANILAEPLRGGGAVGDDVLQKVQDRREFPTRVTQGIQIFMQNNVIGSALASQGELKPPLLLRLLRIFPLLRRFRRGC